MKISFICAAGVLISFIVLFVIVDCKDFYSDGRIVVSNEFYKENESIVSQPVNQPASYQSAVSQQVSEQNSAEETVVIPVENPIEIESVEAKSEPVTKTGVTTETESIAKTQHVEVDYPTPAATPVVTPEDAEELNQKAIVFALAEKEKREPFYTFYQNKDYKKVCFEGTVRAVSLIPNPEKNDYDNCLYALFVEINSLMSEISQEMKIASEVIVNVPIMKDKTILLDNKFLPGDKIWCTCAEYDEMPQKIQEIQLSDDIQSYEHQQYFPFEITKISSFWKNGNRNFAKREITILPIQTLPKDEEAVTLRKEHIQSEINRIEEELKLHGGSFEKWKEEYKPIGEKYKQLSSEGYKGWINDSFFAAVEGAESHYNTQEYIDGILPYKKYLEKNNIDLIIVRIPSKRDFAARVLASDDFQENPAWVEHYYECLKNDIEIVDPMQEMWKHRLDFPLFYFFHIPTEGHPFEGTSMISAKVLSDVLKRYNYSKTNQPITLEDSDYKTTDKSYFWPEGNAKKNPEDNIVFKQTNQDGKPIGDLVANTGSPFLFLSNSFFKYPCRELGASVPGYAAFFLQHIPDWFYQNGIGNAMIRTLMANQELLSNRKVVIMVGHPSFWSGGFPKLPKYLYDKATNITQEKTLDLIDDKLVISAMDGCTFTKGEDGEVHITLEADQRFTMGISIPPIEGKQTCMVRLNYEKSSHLVLEAFSEDNSLIDNVTMAIGYNNCADLFIPVSDHPTNISIRCSPKADRSLFTQTKIELWYY